MNTKNDMKESSSWRCLPKALLFDYGGTLDTGGIHWGVLLWHLWHSQIPTLQKAHFRRAYSETERLLSEGNKIGTRFTFRQVLLTKLYLQFQNLKEHRNLPPLTDRSVVERITDNAYAWAFNATQESASLLTELQKRLPIGLVSNFYGNLHTVLDEFGLRSFFSVVVESAAISISKPNPAIFRIALGRLGLPADQVLMIGDSYTNDISVAQNLGMQTRWLKKESWEEASSAYPKEQICSDFVSLKESLDKLLLQPEIS